MEIKSLELYQLLFELHNTAIGFLCILLKIP